ncbi:hypothetical protein [Pseudofrankia sp. BMG5.37]|uniref:hypothetical protein n=1 Tax=Pseudofrankia sp. BMG5.37 TaxID=3050035 RepID=UPI00289541AF|nr:hypothetical protein [Pseudofrankia sp. BMG5.37]MDT3438978.1 hypothetical protein [Pseudofrankia sp. BMG5.37]
MAELVDLIVRRDEGTWAAWSPRCPGLAIVQLSQPDLVREARGAIREFLQPAADLAATGERDRDLLVDLRVHVEGEIRGVVVRVCQDEHLWERQHVAERLSAALGDPAQATNLAARRTTALGDVVFVCAMPTDTLDWVFEQMQPGDALSMVVSVADNMIWVSTFSHDEFRPDRADGGLPVTTTIAEIMQLDNAPLHAPLHVAA